MSERFGEYELLRKIATGGMAEIYLARQGGMEGFSRRVVVKKMLPQLAVRPDFVTMFLDEARLAANLNHPNIVQVFNLGKVDEAYFMAMELIDGPHLGALFASTLRAQNPLPLTHCAYIVARAADGLAYAHEQVDPATGKHLNLVHRDISPQNILVSRFGDIKVTDFGVAKAETQQTKTRTGIIKGKVSYMSPEQCLGERVDRTTDVFALGVVLYELLTRRRLFREKSDLLVMQRITTQDVPSPVTVNPEVDEELAQITLRAIAKRPEDRYASAGELSEALDLWLATHGHVDGRGRLQRWLQANAEGLAIDVGASEPVSSASSPSQSAAEIRPVEPASPVVPDATTARGDGAMSEGTVSTPALGSAHRASVSGEHASLPSETAQDPASSPDAGGAHDTLARALPAEDTVIALVPGFDDVSPRRRVPLAAALGLLGGILAISAWYLVSGSGATSTEPQIAAVPPAMADAQVGGHATVDGGAAGGSAVEPAANVATLQIRTEPAGVALVVDNVPVGMSPTELSYALGQHVVTAQFPDQPPVSVQVDLTRAHLEAPVDLLIQARTPLRIASSPPGAALSVNGAASGVTPQAEIWLEPGVPVAIDLTKPGFETWKRNVTPEPGVPISLQAELKKRESRASTPKPAPTGQGMLRVDCRPWANVYVDGRAVGVTPTNSLSLKAGLHTVKVDNRELGFSKTTQVNVKKDRVATVGFKFKKAGGAWVFDTVVK